MEKIPFKVGQQAEARSFDTGFRGAWFRCKIREFATRKGILGHISEYYDYPDETYSSLCGGSRPLFQHICITENMEELKWEELYHVPPYCMGNAKQKHKELVLRPPYPPIYNEKQMPDVREISEVIVIVCDSWKVDDLVDWLDTGCYWSGRIIQLFNDQEAQIELKPLPHGEGSSYKVILKDLRPSLDWSPEHGWTVLTQEGGTSHPYARLIKPINQGQETEASRPIGLFSRLSFSSPVSSNSVVSSEVKRKRKIETQKRSQGTTISKVQKDDREKRASNERGDSSTRKINRVDADSKHSATEQAVEVAEDDLNCRKFTASGEGALNSKRSDTLEAPVLDLEEYINKVKWLKKILKYGISSYEDHRLELEFVEPRGASEIPK